MLIIEGTDLVGKTTLAKTLLQHEFFQDNGYVYQHLSRLPLGFNFRQYLDLASQRVIRDRFHMSEIAYSAMRGEETFLGPERYRWVDAHLRLLGTMTVILTATTALLQSRMREGEMYNLEQILNVNRRFIDIVNRKVSAYDMDWDYHIHCSVQHPVPTQGHITDLMRLYLQRQDQLP